MTNPVPIRNAGLCLLSSYIPMLFARLGLVSENKFVSTNAQLRAVHYLQYLVTGLSHTEDSFLAFNKVLCGIPIDKAVGDAIEFTPEEKQLMDGLLMTVIANWPAIGDCTIDGFRGNWLVRNGVLHEGIEKSELTVEKRPYDVLIHKSPFSFSIVKFHWMSNPLHVTWPY